MPAVGQIERKTQQRVVKLFRERLGYAYLGDWTDREGNANIDASRIWLNLELAKKPVQCLEYLIVHELAHLVERQHNDRFVSLMDLHLPDWRGRRQELNAAPLRHESWTY